MQRATVWVVSTHVRTTHLEDGTTILLDIKKGAFCKLNAAGSRIWRVIASSPGGVKLEGIVTALQSQNGEVLYKQLETDAIGYLEKLERMEVIHRTPFLSSRESHIKKRV
jgi:hypothetical protein